MAGPLRGGGGVKVRAIKGKKNFFFNLPKFQRPLSSKGEGGLGLNDPAIKKRTSFSAPLSEINFYNVFPQVQLKRPKDASKPY